MQTLNYKRLRGIAEKATVQSMEGGIMVLYLQRDGESYRICDSSGHSHLFHSLDEIHSCLSHVNYGKLDFEHSIADDEMVGGEKPADKNLTSKLH